MFDVKLHLRNLDEAAQAVADEDVTHASNEALVAIGEAVFITLETVMNLAVRTLGELDARGVVVPAEVLAAHPAAS